MDADRQGTTNGTTRDDPAGTPLRIAVIRTGALGDFLLGLPALAALRRRYPRARLVMIGPMPAARLARWGDIAGEVVDVGDTALAPLFGGGPPPAVLRGVDTAVLWLRSPDDVALALAAHGVMRRLAAPPFPPAGRREHVAEWLAQTLAPLGVSLPEGWDGVPWLRLPPVAEETGSGGRPAIAGNRPYIVLHPGSGSARKNWPPERWAEVAGRLRRRHACALVITTGPADEVVVGELKHALARVGVQGHVYRVTGLDLEALAIVLDGAMLYLGNDSGVTHLAAALGTRVVSVFGPTDPSVWRPRGPWVRVLGGAPSSGRDGIFAEVSRWPEPAAVLSAAEALLERAYGGSRAPDG
jgi:heptosyltransferase III